MRHFGKTILSKPCHKTIASDQGMHLGDQALLNNTASKECISSSGHSRVQKVCKCASELGLQAATA